MYSLTDQMKKEVQEVPITISELIEKRISKHFLK
jgi:hypothetical protein